MNSSYTRKKRRKTAGILLLCLLTVCSSAMAAYAVKRMTEYREEADRLRMEKENFEVAVYVAAQDLRKGTVLEKEKVRLELRYTEEKKEVYMTEQDFGKVLLADVKEGESLRKNMAECSRESVRETELSEIEVPAYLKAGNKVDVRISFHNAEDYVVLSEKRLISCEEKKGIVLEMTEQEILYLSSARTDCERYADTRLYVVKYPDVGQMQTGIVNYVPNKEILDLLGEEGLAGKRAALEERLKEEKRR